MSSTHHSSIQPHHLYTGMDSPHFSVEFATAHRVCGINETPSSVGLDFEIGPGGFAPLDTVTAPRLVCLSCLHRFALIALTAEHRIRELQPEES